jgi:hypothetical protein
LTQVVDSPGPLGDDRSAKVLSILDAGGPLAQWILLYITTLQRPLYVGQTGNLNTRFRAHVRIGSTFRGYLDEAGLLLRDCSLAFIRLPDVLQRESSVESDPELDDEGEYSEAAGGSAALDVLEALLQRTTRPLLARKLE